MQQIRDKNWPHVTASESLVLPVSLPVTLSLSKEENGQKYCFIVKFDRVSILCVLPVHHIRTVVISGQGCYLGPCLVLWS